MASERGLVGTRSDGRNIATIQKNPWKIWDFFTSALLPSSWTWFTPPPCLRWIWLCSMHLKKLNSPRTTIILFSFWKGKGATDLWAMNLLLSSVRSHDWKQPKQPKQPTTPLGVVLQDRCRMFSCTMGHPQFGSMSSSSSWASDTWHGERETTPLLCQTTTRISSSPLLRSFKLLKMILKRPKGSKPFAWFRHRPSSASVVFRLR